MYQVFCLRKDVISSICFSAAKHSQKVVDAEQVRKIREDYERKLTAMRDEFRKLQSVEREHRRMQAKQVAEQQQLLRLRNELNELKKTKVDLTGG